MLVQGVRDYAIYMLDTEGRVTNWNSGAQSIKGYTADEIVGAAFLPFLYGRGRGRAASPSSRWRPRCAKGRYEREGMARAQGRLAVLGERRPRPDLRR